MRETADLFSPHQAENVAALCQFPVCQAQRAIHRRTADDLNLYAYVGNNRGNFSGPSGLAAEDLKLFAGKVSGSMDNW